MCLGTLQFLTRPPAQRLVKSSNLQHLLFKNVRSTAKGPEHNALGLHGCLVRPEIVGHYGGNANA
jgi:hypothetical protein